MRVVPSVRRASSVTSAKLELGLQGDAGAVHLEVALNWFVGELPAKTREEYPPQGIGLHVHRATPADRPGFARSEGLCIWLRGAQCFPDHLGSSAAEDLALDLRDRGDESVWEQLERLYRERLVG